MTRKKFNNLNDIYCFILTIKPPLVEVYKYHFTNYYLNRRIRIRVILYNLLTIKTRDKRLI